MIHTKTVLFRVQTDEGTIHKEKTIKDMYSQINREPETCTFNERMMPN